jgi:hypothetical protein
MYYKQTIYFEEKHASEQFLFRKVYHYVQRYDLVC